MARNFDDGIYQFKVEDEVYDIELINIRENKVYSVSDGANISLGSATADQHTLIVKYHGDLTIEEGVTLTSKARKKVCLFMLMVL